MPPRPSTHSSSARETVSTHRVTTVRVPPTHAAVAVLSAMSVLALAFGADALTHPNGATQQAIPPSYQAPTTSTNPWPTSHTPGTATPTTISTGAPATTAPAARPMPTFTPLPTHVPVSPAPADPAPPVSHTPRPAPTFPTATQGRPTGTAPRPTWPDANQPSLPVPTVVPTGNTVPPVTPLPPAPKPSAPEPSTPSVVVHPSMPSVLPGVDA